MSRTRPITERPTARLRKLGRLAGGIAAVKNPDFVPLKPGHITAISAAWAPDRIGGMTCP